MGARCSGGGLPVLDIDPFILCDTCGTEPQTQVSGAQGVGSGSSRVEQMPASTGLRALHREHMSAQVEEVHMEGRVGIRTPRLLQIERRSTIRFSGISCFLDSGMDAKAQAVRLDYWKRVCTPKAVCLVTVIFSLFAITPAMLTYVKSDATTTSTTFRTSTTDFTTTTGSTAEFTTTISTTPMPASIGQVGSTTVFSTTMSINPMRASIGQVGSTTEFNNTTRTTETNTSDVVYSALANVSFSMRVQHVSFDGLLAENSLITGFCEHVQKAIAVEAGHGVSPGNVWLFLNPGSILVEAKIVGLSRAVVDAVRLALSDSSTFAQTVLEGVLAVQGVQAISSGNIYVTDIGEIRISSASESAKSSFEFALPVVICCVVMFVLALCLFSFHKSDGYAIAPSEHASDKKSPAVEDAVNYDTECSFPKQPHEVQLKDNIENSDDCLPDSIENSDGFGDAVMGSHAAKASQSETVRGEQPSQRTL